MTDPNMRAGAMLGVVVRLLADLGIIAIAIVLCLSAAGAVNLH